MELRTSERTTTAVLEFLSGGGEMGQRIREYDWSNTSLGPVDTWPQSLRTCIRIMLTSRQPIWIGWGKELIKFYNDPYKAIVKGKHPWALGTPASIVWKDIWHDIQPMLKQVMEKDEGTYVESQLLIMERNGYPEETYYTFSYTPIPGDDGKTAGMFCANTDDTDKIISERQLRTLTQLGKRLTDSHNSKEIIEKTMATLEENPYDFSFAIFRTITDNKAIFSHSTPLGAASSLVKKEVDLRADNPISQTVRKAFDTLTPQVLDGAISKIGELPKGAWQVSPDKVMVLPIVQSGTKEPYGFLVVGLNPYRLLDDKYLGFFSLVADQIATSFADVHVLEEERKRAEALAEIDRAKTIFFSNISHEFRTPLTLLLGPIEDALNDADTVPINRGRMELAYRNALRMQKLVNTLLEFSRIEAGRVEGHFGKADICQLTRDFSSTFRSAIEKAGMQLEFACGEITEDVYVDTEMWEKIVLNLISNAFKYSQRGTISIRVAEVNKHIQLSVSDTGVGIPPDQLDKIFDRFHRIEKTHGRSQEGSGIGLAMVKELIRLHNGSISVESKVGVGSTFTVTIPTGKAHLPEDKIVVDVAANNTSRYADVFVQEAMKWLPQQHSSERSDHFAAEENISVDKPTVVLADDNADMREYVYRLLSNEFNVITAVNGEEAFQKALRYKPQLVLSDVMMPKVDGFGLLKQLRSNSTTENIPVIFLSARAGDEAKVEGLDAGADDYLVKPFSAKELFAKVVSHIKINELRKHALQSIYNLFYEVPFTVAVLKGKELVIEFINRNNLQIWQLKEDDVLGKPLAKVFPGNWKSLAPVHEHVFKTGQRFVGSETPAELSVDGKLETRFFNAIIDPLKNERGEIIGQLATSIDVTDFVLSRRKIEESEAYFRRVADTVPATIWITEKDGYCSYLNKQWYETTGQSKEEALGFGWLKATHPDDVERAGKIFLDANDRAVPFSILYRLKQNNGEYRWAIDSGRPRQDEKGNFTGFIGSVIDVHEEKEAEKALRESESGFRQLANAMPQLVWVAESDGTVIYYNDRIAEFAGATKSEGQWQWEGLVHENDRQSTEQAWALAVSDGTVYQIEHRIKMRDGSFRWFLSRAYPQKDEKGTVIKWFGTATDIHSSKEQSFILEEEVRKRTQQLRELNLSLQQSNNELQQFAHVASHDLKEPLRKIRTFSGRLEMDGNSSFSEKAKGFVDKINSAAERMNSMIEGVLNYSMLNSSEQKIAPVDLNETVKNIETDLELLIMQKSATLHYSGLPVVEGASVLLYQLFYNLINNSLKFARMDVPVAIKISCRQIKKDGKDLAEITVSDNGIGFQQEFAEKIFETFSRLNSKDQFEGTGLGLSLCKRIAERHGGTITAHGKPGEGANFVITLPLRLERKNL